MILQALVDHYEALVAQGKIAQPGWVTAKIAYALNIDAEGALLGVLPLKETKTVGKKTKEIPQELVVPVGLKRAVAIAPQFLWDNASYFFGVDTKNDPARAKKCFEAAKRRHLELLENAQGEFATAIKKYFLNWDVDKAADNEYIKSYEDILTAANLVFVLNGTMPYAQDDPEIKAIWNSYYANKAAGKQGQCLVTGKVAPIAVLHPAIKGVRGGQAAGTSLVSFNAAAYESYGHVKEQGLNGPVSEYAAFEYGAALNYLLANDQNHMVFGDTTFVYWAEAADNIFAGMFGSYFSENVVEENTLNDLFSKLSKGEPVVVDGLPLEPQNKFYILALSPNAARLSVRFFLQSSIGKIANNLVQHHEDLNITKPVYEKYNTIPLWKLLQETANKNAKEKMATPLLTGAVFKAILNGGKYPQALMQNIILRVKAEQDNQEKGIKKIGWIKAAILKACLRRNYDNKEVTTVALNEESNNKAYVLGRLFAVLEDLQQNANNGIVATIKDRYFNAACATPAAIFPVLMKLAGAHLKKVTYKTTFEKRIGMLYDKITMGNDPIPNRLSLEEQGIFILGYYHQVQARYVKKEEK